MMSSDKIPTKAPTSDNQSSGSRKTGSPRPPEPNLKCPRCDSPNTKFCYYNNYNLSQPRHFCKTCRRYWTRGGALRNVPVGGGCRKNKKIKSGSRLSDDSKDMGGGAGSYDSAGGFKFFHGVSPAMDFQYGRLPFSRLNSPSSSNVYNHLFSFGDLSSSATSAASLGAASTSPCFDIDGNGGPSSTNSLMGFSLPVRQADQSSGFNWGVHDNLAMNIHSNLASSIESLSSINQDLHWKLQQQRLAMLYVGENHKESNSNCNSSNNNNSSVLGNQMVQNSQPICFQNLEISKPDSSAAIDVNNSSGTGTTTEWLFENSYPAATTATSSNSNGNDGMSNWNRVQVWSDLNHYSGLPQ